MNRDIRIAVYCVGNVLMLDDGVGPAVYKELCAYQFPDQVDVYDLGCLTLDRINDVRDYDVIVTVDAVDGTGLSPGSVVRYEPEDMAARSFGTQSLHDLSLSDLFASASLLGYECEGVCLGMQVENASPALATMGLTADVHSNLPALVDCVLSELVGRGMKIVHARTGTVVEPGFSHLVVQSDGA